VECMAWLCLAAPAATPVALTDKLNADVKTILAAPDFTKRLADLGSVPAPSAPEDTRRMVADAITRWADVIKRGNIKVD
jgi:tripartite-type tricarboxylate transporter receptor subunit TctC